MKVSIIIPCYNEEDSIGKVIEEAYAAELPPGWEREVIVVDDGSNDKTAAIIRKLTARFPFLRLLTNATNEGKGAALKRAFAVAVGDYFLIQDADTEYSPLFDYPRLVEPLMRAKNKIIVFGSRNIGPAHQHGGYLFRIGGKITTAIFNVLFGSSLTDIHTCYKLFPKTITESLLNYPANGFEFDAVALTHAAIVSPFPVIEIPLKYYERRNPEEGKKLRAWDGVECVKEMIRLKMHR